VACGGHNKRPRYLGSEKPLACGREEALGEPSFGGGASEHNGKSHGQTKKGKKGSGSFLNSVKVKRIGLEKVKNFGRRLRGGQWGAAKTKTIINQVGKTEQRFRTGGGGQ